MKTWAQKRTGFTIVELLIVIVVIGILAAITIVAYNGVQARSKIASTNATMAQLRKSMLSYKADTGELPPLGDSWNYDTNPPSCPAFTNVISSLTNAGFTGNQARDAWGNCFGYDDNDCNSGSGANSMSFLTSVGPNGVYDNGGVDDIRLQISPGC